MKQLIIPFCVEAYLSNGKTVDQKRVPVISPDYRKVSYTSFLGSRQTPDAFQTASVLKAGVHLHFILPDAFRHVRKDGYPAVPNRYIVTRLYVDMEEKINVKCFVVESDFMSCDPAYSDSITIPRFQETDLRKNWRYLGRSYPLDASPKPNDRDEYLEKLTAIGAGDPMFAAYYPSCASVFGFYDDLRDVPLNTVLSYFVVGYYSDAKNDCFYGIQTEADFQKLLAEMNFSVMQKAEVCNRSALFGQISGITWKGTQEEYTSEPVGEIRVSVGSTSAEALSAAVCHAAGASSDVERILTALQYDLIDDGTYADNQYHVDDEIYERQFHRFTGKEARYELVYPQKQQSEDQIPALGRYFSDYCRANEKLAEQKRQLRSAQEKLFYAWEQYMLCYENPRITPVDVPEKSEMRKEIERIISEEIEGLRDQIGEQKKKIKLCLAKLKKENIVDAEIIETASEPFHAPKDPVLLFSGPGMKRTYAFGEDGRFSNDGTLTCQTQTFQINIDRSALLGCIRDTSFFEKVPEIYQKLFYQGVLMSDDCLAVIEKMLGKVVISGEMPSAAAKNRYHCEPITLFMAWEAEYLPLDPGGDPQKALDGWEYRADETNYRYIGKMTPSQLNKELVTGRTVLTPHAVLHLSKSFKRWQELHPDDTEITELEKKIKNLAVVSQNLDGFTNARLGLSNKLQFPIIGAGGDEDMARNVSEHVLPERTSMIPDGVFRPLRGGMLGIRRLSLIGTFGQTQVVLEQSPLGKAALMFSETLQKIDDRYVVLSPAFHQPARLRFQFHSAQSDEVITSSAPETSPVYGIILPELLNRRLMIYDSVGTYIGSVSTAYEGDQTVARWVDASFPERPFEQTEISDSRFRDFLRALLTVPHALSDFLRLIDIYYEKKLIPQGEKLIWGRPFVLARCSLRFEFSGTPEYDKKLSSFGTYDTGGAEQFCFPVMLGDMERSMDGVLGYFDDAYGYEGMCPAFGTDIKAEGSFLLPQDHVKISAASGARQISVVMAGHAPLCVQTGLLPRQIMSIPEPHASAADKILPAAEMNPVITAISGITLPVREYEWQYRMEDTCARSKIMQPMVCFDETVIMDGFLVKEQR